MPTNALLRALHAALSYSIKEDDVVEFTDARLCEAHPGWAVVRGTRGAFSRTYVVDCSGAGTPVHEMMGYRRVSDDDAIQHVKGKIANIEAAEGAA